MINQKLTNMKTRRIFMTTLCSLMLGMGFASCSENEDDELIIDPVDKPN